MYNARTIIRKEIPPHESRDDYRMMMIMMVSNNINKKGRDKTHFHENKNRRNTPQDFLKIYIFLKKPVSSLRSGFFFFFLAIVLKARAKDIALHRLHTSQKKKNFSDADTIFPPPI